MSRAAGRLPLFALAALLTFNAAPILAQCGVERWSVKTGTDADVGLVNLNASTATTISYLRGLATPASLPANNRIQPTETTVFTINATLTQYKLESDSDYHLVIQDASGNTMIAEIPSPNCVGAGSPFGPGIQNARSEFDAKYTATGSFQTANIPIAIKGVGMFDFLHGQTGVAPNGIELHPLLDIVFNPGGGGGSSALANGDFETGSTSGWTTTGTAAVNTAAKHAGTYGLQLGSTSPTTDSTAAQTFTLPSNATTLSFYYSNTCPDTVTYDWATATLKDNVTGTTSTILAKTCTTSPSWTLVNYNASSSAGHSVTLTLANHDDNYAGDATFTYFDDVAVGTGGTGDTTAPTTSITSPAAGATVSGTISVTASASDNVGVTKVEFYLDGALKSTSTTSPYSWSFNTTTVANGSHTLQSKAYDAANNVGSSASVSVTVSNTTTTTQLLGNPGFENGSTNTAPWTTSSGVVDNSTGEAAHSGSWKAWMDGYGSAHTDSIVQTVAIPTGKTSATLTFWLHIDTAETTTTTQYDKLQVQVRNSSGTVLATLATYSNLNAAAGYTQKSFNLNSYIGQTIQVYLVGTEDSSSQTSFVVDDFALNVQ